MEIRRATGVPPSACQGKVQQPQHFDAVLGIGALARQHVLLLRGLRPGSPATSTAGACAGPSRGAHLLVRPRVAAFNCASKLPHFRRVAGDHVGGFAGVLRQVVQFGPGRADVLPAVRAHAAQLGPPHVELGNSDSAYEYAAGNCLAVRTPA